MKILEEQQRSFQECSLTFQHGILVAFTAYHAIYSGMMLFNLLQAPQERPAAKQKFKQRDLILTSTMSKEENILYMQDLNKLYEEQVRAKSLSLCDAIFDLRNLLLSFGFFLTAYSISQVHSKQHACFNYSSLSITWTIFEIVSFALWLVASFIIDAYRFDQKETIVNKALAQKFKADSNKSRVSKLRGHRNQQIIQRA